MSKLWQKNWKLDALVEKFETKDDLIFDQRLLLYDVYGTLAHAMMLEKMGILKKEELVLVKKGLKEILKKNEQGEFQLTFGDEDIHTKIETYLTEHFEGVGKKVHTGRSRNDQVLTAIRLFTKEELLEIWNLLLGLAESFLGFAKQYELVPMPGYTHMQKAMPSSVGMWAASFAQNLLDDLIALKAVYELNNQSPLGSAAGYGVPLKLDREYSAKLLGFDRVQTNPLAVQNSRGKIEAAVVSAFCSILFDISKFASDVLLFTTSEFDFFEVADKLCTGSSIMPQKRNIDVAELLRSKIHIMQGYYLQILGISSGLISGYNRDVQDTKKPFFEAIELTQDCLKVATILVQNITPKEENLKKALTPEIFATHKALEKVLAGTPFRQAYQEVGISVAEYDVEDVEKILKKSAHIGGTGNLGLKAFDLQLQKEKKHYEKDQTLFDKALKQLLAS